MDLSIAWWIWILVGFALLLGELLTPGGFFIVFFGVGAIAVGLLKVSGLVTSLAMEGILFASISVAGLVLFRRPLQEEFKELTPNMPVDQITSEIATALETIPAGGMGKVELRGTSWNAHNAGSEPIENAQRCRIEKVDGLTLHVRPVSPNVRQTSGTEEPPKWN